MIFLILFLLSFSIQLESNKQKQTKILNDLCKKDNHISHCSFGYDKYEQVYIEKLLKDIKISDCECIKSCLMRNTKNAKSHSIEKKCLFIQILLLSNNIMFKLYLDWIKGGFNLLSDDLQAYVDFEGRQCRIKRSSLFDVNEQFIDEEFSALCFRYTLTYHENSDILYELNIITKKINDLLIGSLRNSYQLITTISSKGYIEIDPFMVKGYFPEEYSRYLTIIDQGEEIASIKNIIENKFNQICSHFHFLKTRLLFNAFFLTNNTISLLTFNSDDTYFLNARLHFNVFC